MPVPINVIEARAAVVRGVGGNGVLLKHLTNILLDSPAGIVTNLGRVEVEVLAVRGNADGVGRRCLEDGVHEHAALVAVVANHERCAMFEAASIDQVDGLPYF